MLNDTAKQSLQDIEAAMGIYCDPAVLGRSIPKAAVDDLRWLVCVVEGQDRRIDEACRLLKAMLDTYCQHTCPSELPHEATCQEAIAWLCMPPIGRLQP